MSDRNFYHANWLIRATLSGILLLAVVSCGPSGSYHELSDSTESPQNYTQSEHERAANFKPLPMPGAKYTQDNIDIREWVADTASTFQFHNHSYNDYELPAGTRWEDVLAHYDEQMSQAGWSNDFVRENQAFYKWQDPTSSVEQFMVMIYVPGNSEEPPRLTLIYSFVGSEDSNLILNGSYDTGFVLQQDSLAFENYEDQYPQGNMNIDDVREVFGDDVCMRFEDENDCVPIPNAELWIEQMVNLSSQGHCVGMTVLSGLRFAGLYDIPQYSDRSTYEFPQDSDVLRKINRDWALQVAYEVTGAQVDGSPRKIISELLKTDELVDIGIYTADGGHSLLGYGVEEKGDGIFWIRVYDGNNPGVLNYVEVDVNTNTWAYSPTGLDPSNDPDAWRGDASSETLMFIPISAYSQGLTCPFCFRNSSSASLNNLEDGYLPAALLAARKAMPGYTMVSLAAGGNSDLQATTTTGERVGVADNQIVNDLPAARVVRLRGNESGVILLMPPDVDFSLQAEVELDSASSRSSLVVLGQGLSFGAYNLSSQQVNMGYSQTTNQVSYASNGDSAPIFKMVTQQQGGEANMYTISGGSIPEGGEISFALDGNNGSFIINGTGLGDLFSFIMAIARITSSGDSIFATDRLSIEGGAAAALDMAGWSGEGPIRVGFDFDGDFSVDQTYILPDQPLASILDNLGTAGNILDGVGTFGVYMDANERNAFLNTLGNLGLSGSDLGTVVIGFNDSFGFTDRQLAQLAQQWGLSGSEMAGFAAGLHMDDQQIAPFLALPPLPPLYTPPSSSSANTGDAETPEDEEEEEEEVLPAPTSPPSSTVSYASFGDLVWNDLNSNGVQDAGENGIAGVTLNIYRDENTDGVIDGGDTLIGATTTGTNGAYDFATLTAGVYLVNIPTPPTGMVLVSGTLPHQATLAAGQDYNSADFGYKSNTGNVNGYIEVGCSAADGISLGIYSCDASNNCGAALQTVLTAGGGYYTFTNLPQPDPGQHYNVIYDNSGESDKVKRWRGLDITSITVGGTVPGGDFDLNNFALTTPTNGATGVDHTAAIAFDWDNYSFCIPGLTITSYSFNIAGTPFNSGASVDGLGTSDYTMSDPTHFISSTSGLFSNSTYTWYANVVTSQGSATPYQEFTFTTFMPPPPPNDDIGSAITVTLSGNTFSDSQETANASNDANDPKTCTGDAFKSVWYKFTTPSGGGKLTIDTEGSGYDTVLAVYTDPVGPTSIHVVCDDDGGVGFDGFNSLISAFPVTSGDVYYIVVAGFGGTSAGTMYLNITFTP